ncbi:MAG: fatty acid desaturase [Planctomycetota bacterium]|nr:fatty acid desaturase [Planctomycetota bacterium]
MHTAAQVAETPDESGTASARRWRELVAEHQVPSAKRATWQLFNTLGSYAAVWYLIYLSASVSWWLALPLACFAGALMVRSFILFHDCCHGSFFESKLANDIVGFTIGVLTFTPYTHWRWEHALHHATAGNLDRRGVGDLWTLTVREYLEASRWKRFAYRLARNPFVLFVLAPLAMFIVVQRFPARKANARDRRSVWLTNLAIVCVGFGMSLAFGFVPYLILQLTAMAVGGAAGIWLFYVQHQFEDAYWENTESWDFTAAALKGSSFYKLPKVLQWLSGNIGFHHIHHLSTKIPNYNLERCHHSDPLFQRVKAITLLGSSKTLRLRLWDESSRKLIGFRKLAELRRSRAADVVASRAARR